jgi:hypothetical protein
MFPLRARSVEINKTVMINNLTTLKRLEKKLIVLLNRSVILLFFPSNITYEYLLFLGLFIFQNNNNL